MTRSDFEDKLKTFKSVSPLLYGLGTLEVEQVEALQWYQMAADQDYQLAQLMVKQLKVGKFDHINVSQCVSDDNYTYEGQPS